MNDSWRTPIGISQPGWFTFAKDCPVVVVAKLYMQIARLVRKGNARGNELLANRGRNIASENNPPAAHSLGSALAAGSSRCLGQHCVHERAIQVGPFHLHRKAMPPPRGCQLESFRGWIKVNLPDEWYSPEVRQRPVPDRKSTR